MQPDQFWMQFLLAVISGGISGALLQFALEALRNRQTSKSEERSAISTLLGEITQSQSFCYFNGSYGKGGNATFLEIPSRMAAYITYEKGRSYSRLVPILPKLQQYAVIIASLNERIRIHNSLSLEGRFDSAYRNQLRDEVISVSSGDQKFTDLPFENLPTLLQSLLDDIEKLR